MTYILEIILMIYSKKNISTENRNIIVANLNQENFGSFLKKYLIFKLSWIGKKKKHREKTKRPKEPYYYRVWC